MVAADGLGSGQHGQPDGMRARVQLALKRVHRAQRAEALECLDRGFGHVEVGRIQHRTDVLEVLLLRGQGREGQHGLHGHALGGIAQCWGDGFDCAPQILGHQLGVG